MANLYQEAINLYNNQKYEQAKELFLECISIKQYYAQSIVYMIRISDCLNDEQEKIKWINKIAHYYQYEFCT